MTGTAKVIEYTAATISLALDKMVTDLPDTAAPQATAPHETTRKQPHGAFL